MLRNKLIWTLLGASIILSGCTAQSTEPELSVETVIDVCNAQECFTTRVPAQIYGTIGNTNIDFHAENGYGSSKLEQTGQVEVTAKWAGLERKVTTSTNADGYQSLTVKFTEQATIPINRR